MGSGDDIIATGMARGAAARGKRIAFGDGRRIIFGPWSKAIFEGNPNIAWPGQEGSPDLEWIPYYKGNRQYNRQDPALNRWLWNYDFRVEPGEFFFKDSPPAIEPGFIFIEPNVARGKKGPGNKDLGFEKYQAVVDALKDLHIVQCDYPTARILRGVEPIKTTSFRDAVNLMRNASLYIGPEGGMHHAAAALGLPGIVIFGGWIPPAVMGYEGHINLTGGATEWCGSLSQCRHCADALNNITVEDIVRNV